MKETHPNAKDIPLRDHYFKVYWVIFLVGIVCMLPWDILVTVNGYWNYKFRNQTFDGQNGSSAIVNHHDLIKLTKWQKEFESYVSIASSIPSCTVVLLHAWIGNRYSVHRRAIFSMVGMILSFIGIIILAYLDSDDFTGLFLSANLTLAVIINIFRALCLATNMSNMGKFPVIYMGSLANGITMGGIIPVVVNIVILSLDVDIQMAGFGCFLFACVLVVLCLILFLCMERNEFYQFYTKLGNQSDQTELKLTYDVLKEVLCHCWLFMLTLFFVTTTTALIYPASTSLIKPAHPNHSEWHEVYFSQRLILTKESDREILREREEIASGKDKSLCKRFFSVTCFLAFNICNYLGTVISGLIQWPGKTTSANSQVVLLLLSVLRVVFIPTFLMCNLAPSDRTHPVYLPNDPIFVITMVLFSLSDGYLTNMTFMFGPKASAKDKHQEITAGILVATQTTSLMIGSIFSNILVKTL